MVVGQRGLWRKAAEGCKGFKGWLAPSVCWVVSPGAGNFALSVSQVGTPSCAGYKFWGVKTGRGLL